MKFMLFCDEKNSNKTEERVGTSKSGQSLNVNRENLNFLKKLAVFFFRMQQKVLSLLEIYEIHQIAVWKQKNLLKNIYVCKTKKIYQNIFLKKVSPNSNFCQFFSCKMFLYQFCFFVFKNYTYPTGLNRSNLKEIKKCFSNFLGDFFFWLQ